CAAFLTMCPPTPSAAYLKGDNNRDGVASPYCLAFKTIANEEFSSRECDAHISQKMITFSYPGNSAPRSENLTHEYITRYCYMIPKKGDCRKQSKKCTRCT